MSINKLIRLCVLCYLFKKLNMKEVSKDKPLYELNKSFDKKKSYYFLGKNVSDNTISKISKWSYKVNPHEFNSKTSEDIKLLIDRLTPEEISKFDGEETIINGKLIDDLIIHHEVTETNKIIKEFMETRHFKYKLRELRLYEMRNKMRE